jgi:hypothetical protein
MVGDSLSSVMSFPHGDGPLTAVLTEVLYGDERGASAWRSTRPAPQHDLRLTWRTGRSRTSRVYDLYGHLAVELLLIAETRKSTRTSSRLARFGGKPDEN